MIRKKTVLLTLGLSLTTLPTVMAEEETITITVQSAEEPIEGVKIALYKDVTGAERVVDENGEPVILQSDAEGKAVIPYLSGGTCRLENECGYYPDDTVYVLEKEMILNVSPIRVSLRCKGNEIPFHIFDEAGNEVKEKDLQCASSYTITGVNDEQYHGYEPVKFTVAEQYDPLIIETTPCTYGVLNAGITCEDETDEMFTWYLYTDEACLDRAHDLYGKEVGMCVAENTKSEVFLREGTYYLRCENIPARYEKTDPIRVEVKNEETTENVLALNLMRLHVETVDEKTGEHVNCAICLDGDEGNDFAVERGKEYTLRTKVREAGYFQKKEETIMIEEDQKNMKIGFHSFNLKVSAKDAVTDRKVSCAYELYDEDGKKKDEVFAGDIVIVKEVLKEDHYLPDHSQKIEIPKYNDQNETYKVQFTNTPFTTLSVSSNQGIETGIFTDEACTIPIEDLHGQKLQWTAEGKEAHAFDVMEGTYFIKVLSLPENYRKNDEVVKVVADHDVQSVYELAVKAEETEVKIRSLLDEAPLKGVTYEIFDRDQSVKTFTSDGEDVIRGLLRDHSYRIVVKDAEEKLHYAKEQSFTVHGQDEIVFVYRPMITFTLAGEEKCRVSLFNDVYCTEPVYDMNGHEVILAENGDVCIAPGIYYVKTDVHENCYPLCTQQIDCSTDTAFTPSIVRIETMVEIVDENDRPISNVNACIKDSSGRIIETWKSDGLTKCLSSPQLKAGETYLLCENEGEKDGVAFTIPSDQSEESLPIKLVVESDEKKTPWYMNRMYLIGIAALVLTGSTGLVLLKNVSERKSRNL